MENLEPTRVPPANLEPSGNFFRILVVLANGYLGVFAIDAALSLVDDLLLLYPISSLSGIRSTVAGFVVTSSYVLLLLLVLVPRLPKLFLVAPVLFAIWAALGAPPFLGMGETNRFFGGFLDSFQLAVASIIFLAIKKRTGSWFLSPEHLPIPGRPLLRIAISALVLMFGGMIFLTGAVILNVRSLIHNKVDNYLRLTLRGVDLQETVLKKNGKQVRLIAMVHVGKSQFYESLYAGFPSGSLILEEGVSDRKGLLTEKFSYNNFAGVLGYTQQPSISGWKKKIDADRKTGNVPNSDDPLPAEYSLPEVVRADIDVSEFSESTLRFVKRVGEIYQSRNLREFAGKLGSEKNNFTPEQTDRFFKEVVAKRNAHLLSVFDRKSRQHSNIVIPWGALHMPELEIKLKERGFTVAERRYLPYSRYSDFFSKRRNN